MRHQKRVKKLGRKKQHRVSMLRNMATSLIKNERIDTTLSKAKVLRTFVEPIITRAKKANDTQDMNVILHHKREVMKKIKDRDVIVKLFEDIALRYMNRNGGYTRIYKLGPRKGDNAEMAMIELVEELLDTTSTTAKQGSDKKEKSKMGSTKKTQSKKKPVEEKKEPEVKAEESVETTEETPDNKE